MSSSKIYKGAGAAIKSTPLVLERLNSPRKADPLEPAKIGGDSVSTEREAYEKGFHAGEKAGFEFGRQKAEVLFSGLGSVLDEMSRFREEMYKACEKEMVELSLSIAKKVIHSEVGSNREVVVDSVRRALKAVVAGGRIIIKVNQKDIEIIQQYKGELARYGDGVKGVLVEADDSVSRGGCVIDTNYGEIDSTVDSVLAEIEERLRDDK